MTRIQQSLTIESPVEEVTAYTSDPAHMPEWNKMIERVWDIEPTPEVVGTAWKVLVRVMGAEHQVAARVNLYEPLSRFGIELVGGAPGVPGLAAHLVVEARPEHALLTNGSSSSTQIICTLTIRFPILMGGAALGAIVSPIISDQLRRGLLDLKRLLESHGKSSEA